MKVYQQRDPKYSIRICETYDFNYLMKTVATIYGLKSREHILYKMSLTGVAEFAANFLF